MDSVPPGDGNRFPAYVHAVQFLETRLELAKQQATPATDVKYSVALSEDMQGLIYPQVCSGDVRCCGTGFELLPPQRLEIRAVGVLKHWSLNLICELPRGQAQSNSAHRYGVH